MKHYYNSLHQQVNRENKNITTDIKKFHKTLNPFPILIIHKLEINTSLAL